MYALSTAITIKYGGTHLVSIPSSCQCQSTSLSDNRSRICVCGCPAYSFHQNCMQKPENQLKRQWGPNVLSLSFDTKFGTYSSWTKSAWLCNCLHNNLKILHDSITFFLMYILIKNHNHDFSFRTSCMAWTLSTSKEYLHWEWGNCMHFYWVKECTHEILVGFLFFMFTLLITL